MLNIMNIDDNKVIYVFVKRKHLTSVIDELIIHDENTSHLFSLMGTVDHPSFTRTRNWLSEKGYIHKEETWINGDRVLKPFYFNNNLLTKGEKFLCASAWGVQFEMNKKRKMNKILKRKINATHI